MATYMLAAVDVDPITVANAVYIDQVNRFELDPRIADVLVASDGQVDPTYVAVRSQDPRMRFSSTALATILAEASSAFLINGLKIDSDATHDGLEAHWQATAEGGTRGGAGTNIRMTVNEGLLYPVAIRAQQGEDASLDMEAVITYDGTNDPVVIATGQSLIGSPAVGEMFTLGPVKINGSAIADVIGWDLDLGIDCRAIMSDGQVWPTYCYIANRRPRFVVRTLDLSVLNTFGLAGAAQGVTDSVFYLRKRVEGGTIIADATAENISFTLDEGRIYGRMFRGDQDSDAVAELTYVPTWDGTNNIVVVSVAAAIA